MTSSISVTCPERIRTENRREKLNHTWDTELWTVQKAAWIIGKECLFCGSTESLLPHHDDISLYREKTEYMDLSKCIPLCHSCHAAHHKGKVLCPICKDSYIKPGFDCCWNCLPTGHKISISSASWEKEMRLKKARRDADARYRAKLVQGVKV